MTATDLIFLFFCATAVFWGAHLMREWERVDRTRQFWEGIEDSEREWDSWIPTKFCTNEYKINEIINADMIDALWPKIRKEVLNPLDQLEKDLEKANQPIVDRVFNRFNRKA